MTVDLAPDILLRGSAPDRHAPELQIDHWRIDCPISRVTAIRYEVAFEDLVALNVFHARTSPTVRAMQRRFTAVLLPVVFVVAFGLGWVMPHRPGLSYPLFIATFTTLWMAVYLAYYYRRGFAARLRKAALKQYTAQKTPGLVGEHVLEVDAAGFTDRTKHSESRFAWAALERIESEPGYTYLFTGAISAFVIPHNSIAEGDFPALLEQVSLHYRPEATLTART